jgi:acyl carrier protein
MIMADELTDRVLAIVASVKGLPAGQVNAGQSLEMLGIDSLDAITLVFELEEAFHISIPDDRARALRTVQDIIDGVRELGAGAGADPTAAGAGS